MLQPISELEEQESEDRTRPFIVHFQNSELHKGEETKLRTGVYKKKKKTVVAVATKKHLYTGTLNREEVEFYNRFLLVSNRKTKKVRLIAVDTIMLTPHLFNQKINDGDNTGHDGDNTVNDFNSITKLNKEFGSKRIKRITEQRERLKVDINDVREQLEQTVADIELDNAEPFLTEVTENQSLYRPPINRNASVREEVYDLKQLVPLNVLDSLEEEAQGVLTTELKSLNLNPLIEENLEALQNSSAADTLEKCKLFLYLDYLMKYLSKPAKNITKKCIICDSSKDVNNHILDNFSVISNTGRTRPLSMRDKTMCYVLVLSMIAMDYKLDLEVITKNIKVGVKKLQELGKIMAFSTQGKNIMVLKIPLPPAVSVSPKKRKR